MRLGSFRKAALAAAMMTCGVAGAQQINLATQVRGLLAPVNAGTGVDTSGVTGCPKVVSGTWTFSTANCVSSSGVTSFNGRTGAVTLSSSDVAAALSTLTGCGTAGYLYSPGSSDCIPTSGSGVSTFSGDGAFATNSSSTGAVTLTLGNAAAHKFWGNNTSSSGTPGYDSIGFADLPDLTTKFISLGSPFVASPTPNSTTGIQAIGNATNQVVSIVVNGDSFNRCDHTNCGGNGNGPTISTNREPERLRINLQGLFGSHGTGMFPLSVSIGLAPETIDVEGWSITGTYDTNVTALGPFQSSFGTLVHLASGAVATFSDARDIAYDGGNVYFATSSSSGTITIKVDGTTVATASASSYTTAGAVNGGYTARMLTLPSFATSTTHSVTFSGSGDTYLFAFDGTYGTTGISIHNTSFGGATAASVGSAATSQNAFTDLIPGGVQIEYIQFLTNDVALGESTTNFGTYLTNAITHFQDLASAPTSIIAISPVDIVNGTDPMAAYTTVMTGLCSSLSLTCVNFQTQGQTLNGTLIGFSTATPLSSNPWWDFTGSAWPTGNAGVHPSDIGAAVEGNLMTGSILNPESAAGSSVCVTNCTFNDSITVTNPTSGAAAEYNAISTAASQGIGCYHFTVPGVNDLCFAAYGTGNGDGLAGVAGLYDSTTSHFVWSTNTTDDVYGYTPPASGNVAAGAGATWSILHTGTASFGAGAFSASSSLLSFTASTATTPMAISNTNTATSGSAAVSGQFTSPNISGTAIAEVLVGANPSATYGTAFLGYTFTTGSTANSAACAGVGIAGGGAFSGGIGISSAGGIKTGISGTVSCDATKQLEGTGYSIDNSGNLIVLSCSGCPGSGTVGSGTVDGVAYYTGTTTTGSTTAPTTAGHTFALAWQPSGSAVAPAPLDLATYLASPPAIGTTTPGLGKFSTVTDGTCSMSGGALTACSIGTSMVAQFGYFSAASVIAVGTATSGANFASGNSTLTGSYWTGGAAASDTWTIADVLGAGTNPTSTLTVSHSGSPGTAIFALPAGSTSGGSAICTTSTGCTPKVADTTVSVSSGSQGANTCSSATTVTMTNATTSMVALSSFSSNPTSLVGWGSTGGMVFDSWFSASNTLSWILCNQTGTSISYSAATFNVGAQ